jgi:hypothetical protein
LNLNPEYQELPFAKREAVSALVESYSHPEEAVVQIQSHLLEFYRQNHPQVWNYQYNVVKQFVDAVTNIYRTNFFPRMNVDWTTYPNNIGHMTSPGCFRCHDGKHVDDTGQAIRQDCSVCHDFLVPSESGPDALVRTGGFVHPLELKGVHATLRCDQCHTGGPAPIPTCTGCHSDVVAFREGTSPEFSAFSIEPDPMAKQVDCDGCHDLSQPSSITAVNQMCLECHEEDGEEYEAMLPNWDAEIKRLMTNAELLGGDAKLLRSLGRAGPLHNFQASQKILTAIHENAAGSAPDSPSGSQPADETDH